ncbi:MAG: hypothetical protein HPY50_15485 [Firmicutes bacterium]|nr:hypothetical protein [Bacillota bacterium]
MNKFIQGLDLGAQGVWFPIVIGVIALLFVVLMPKKRLNWMGIYLTFGVVGYVTIMLDIFILGQYVDLFDIGDPFLEGIGDLFTYTIIPPCLAVIFLNYFDRLQKWWYVAFFMAVSFSYEWVLTRLGFMVLKGWQNWYSIPVYFLVYSYWLPWHFGLLKSTRGTIEPDAPLYTAKGIADRHGFNIGRVFSVRKKVR